MILVDRTTKYGNPYKVGRFCKRCGDYHGDPGSTLPCYEAWLKEKLALAPEFLKDLGDDELTCSGCEYKSPTCHARILERYRSL